MCNLLVKYKFITDFQWNSKSHKTILNIRRTYQRMTKLCKQIVTLFIIDPTRTVILWHALTLEDRCLRCLGEASNLFWNCQMLAKFWSLTANVLLNTKHRANWNWIWSEVKSKKKIIRICFDIKFVWLWK